MNKEVDEMNNITFGYLRKSEEDKKRQVLSLNDQSNECDKLIENYNLTLTTPYFKEEKSAKKAGVRTEFYKMLELLKKGKAKVVVCWNANRLARNLKDGSEIIDLVQHKGLRIITPYTQYDYSNWFMLLIEFGMSTDFSLKLSKDVKRGLESKVTKGIKPGMAPVGYINVGEIKGQKDIAPDPNKFDLCAEWWKMMSTGEYTVEDSLEKITKMGLRDRRGNPFSKTTAFRFFHSIFYVGYFKYNNEIHEGTHKPMITMDEFNKVQNIITRKFGGKNNTPMLRKPMPLSGFIKCGECGATITADRRMKHYKNGTSQEFAWYRCKKNKGTCTQKAYLASGKLEEQVRLFISNLELDSRFIEWIRKVLKRRNREEFDFDHKQRELLTKKLDSIATRKERVFDMKIDGFYEEDEYKKKKAELLNEEVEIKEQLSSDRISYWEQVIDDTLNFAKGILEEFNTGDDYTKRLILQILGTDLILKDKKLFIKAKSVFSFLRNTQNQLLEESDLVGLKEKPINWDKIALLPLEVPLGAGSGNRTRIT